MEKEEVKEVKEAVEKIVSLSRTVEVVGTGKVKTFPKGIKRTITPSLAESLKEKGAVTIKLQ